MARVAAAAGELEEEFNNHQTALFMLRMFGFRYERLTHLGLFMSGILGGAILTDTFSAMAI